MHGEGLRERLEFLFDLSPTLPITWGEDKTTMNILNFGVIGTGRFGKHYKRLLQEIEGVSLIATASLHENNTVELLANSLIDCLVIASPASTHFQYIKKALENGKHVLVEKPMVLSVKDAEV